MTLTDPTPVSTTLQVSASAHGRIAVLALEGELDAHSAGHLAAHPASRSAVGAQDVILDLQHLYYLDEDGLAALREFAAGLARAGRCLALAAIRPRIRAFLQYTDAQALAPTYATVEAAAEYLRLARAAGA